MTNQQERWRIVGQEIDRRIKELKLTKTAVLKRAGVSDKTLTGYINGQPIMRPDKAQGLCSALAWPPDAIERILAGEPPVPPVDLNHGGSDAEAIAAARLEVDRARAARLAAEARLAEVTAEATRIRSQIEHYAEVGRDAGRTLAEAYERMRETSGAKQRERRVELLLDLIEGLPDSDRDRAVELMESAVADLAAPSMEQFARRPGEKDPVEAAYEELAEPNRRRRASRRRTP